MSDFDFSTWREGIHLLVVLAATSMPTGTTTAVANDHDNKDISCQDEDETWRAYKVHSHFLIIRIQPLFNSRLQPTPTPTTTKMAAAANANRDDKS